MRRKTRENGAPAWGLTELAVGMGKKLARQCHADEKLVIASLYLAHIVFHTDRKSHRMKDHPKLSAKLARGSTRSQFIIAYYHQNLKLLKS